VEKMERYVAIVNISLKMGIFVKKIQTFLILDQEKYQQIFAIAGKKRVKHWFFH
jgi:hypothetical protein